MKGYPAVGESWYRVKCIGLDRRDHVVRLHDGKREFYSGLIFTLRCQCGKTFDLNKLQWRGKKYHRDCGCGLSARDGQNVLKAVSLPVSLWVEINNYALENCSGNASKAFRELAEVGLNVWQGKAI